MYRVRVRFDKLEDKKSIKLEGWIKRYPEVGIEFYVNLDKSDMIVEFGKVFNIKNYGDMLLVQCEFITAEVLIIDNRKGERKILPLIHDHKTLAIQGGKIYGRKRRGAGGAFLRLQSLIKLMKEDAAFDRQPKPTLHLLKGERNYNADSIGNLDDVSQSEGLLRGDQPEVHR